MIRFFGAMACAVVLAASLLATGCARPDPAVEAQAALQAQVAAWNRGDLETALAGYWNSPDVTWVAKGGIGKGMQSFADDMRSQFADRSKMGVFVSKVLDARTVGPDAALLVVEWSITRDGRRLMGGVSTQLWRKVDGRWVAVLEHVS